jgi:Short C-terminal domain
MWEKHYNRYVKSVMKSGKPARAEVISASPSSGHYGVNERFGEASWGWNVHLHVVPQDGEPFELQGKVEIPILMDLVPNMTLQVVYNPEKPLLMVVDPATVPKTLKDNVVANTINTEHWMGGDTTGMKEAAETVSDPIEAAEAAADQARRNFVAKRDDQLAAQHAEVDRVRAEQGDAAADALVAANNQALIAQVYEGFAKVGLSPGPLVAPNAPPPQPAEIEAHLAQLDQLKAAGALDEEEYKAARQRVLDNI